ASGHFTHAAETFELRQLIMLRDARGDVHKLRAQQFAVAFEAHRANGTRATEILDDLKIFEDRTGQFRLDRKIDLLADDRAMNNEDAGHDGQLRMKNEELRYCGMNWFYC